MARLAAALAAASLIIGMLVPGLSSGQVTRAGLVLDLQGRAEAQQAAATRALSPDDALYRGDTVATAVQSRIAIRLGGDSTLRMGASSRLRIDDFLPEAGGTIHLDEGALLLDKDPESAARPVNVDSAFGQIAVRGTEVFVGPSRGTFAVFLARGHVSVSAGGQTVELRAGEGTDIAAPGAPPSPPKAWGADRIDEAMALVR